ncbi:MAG: polysaccharide biosynthesis/export family protein [Pseudomonadota bacterium]
MWCSQSMNFEVNVRQRRLLFALIFSIFGCVALLATPLRAQDYTLQSGDTLRVEITRLGGGGWTSVIDAQGKIRFPFIGKHQAAGLTLDELSEALSLSLVGMQISQQTSTGSIVVVLDESSLYVDIASYRPVTVSGSVARPGQIEFRPGLSVRAALGAVGGASTFSASDPSPDRSLAISTRLEEMLQTQAWLTLDLWRIETQLDPALGKEPPSEVAQILERRLAPSDIEGTQTLIEVAEIDVQERIRSIDDRIVFTETRIAFLQQALEQYAIVSRAEEERLQAALLLKERGLTVANAVNSARSAALSASSRLLNTEADLAETKRELSSLNEQREGVRRDERISLLQNRARVRRSLAELNARMSGLRRELDMVSDPSFATPVEAPSVFTVTIHRTTQSGMRALVAGLDDMILPGDVLEVRFLPVIQ